MINVHLYMNYLCMNFMKKVVFTANIAALEMT